MLAYYLYPFVESQKYREYTEEELKIPRVVKEVFDYCQILEAYITKEGWAFLIDYYGYERLYEIDKTSGWFDEETLEGFIEAVQQEMKEPKDYL